MNDFTPQQAIHFAEMDAQRVMGNLNRSTVKGKITEEIRTNFICVLDVRSFKTLYAVGEADLKKKMKEKNAIACTDVRVEKIHAGGASNPVEYIRLVATIVLP